MLTKEEINEKFPDKPLDQIKSLTMWGCELENIDILQQLKNIEVISLSVNKIKSLKPFENLSELRELYLRKNNISSLDELNFLKNCKKLAILWLEENPICADEKYREKVIEILPNLKKLDNKKINETSNNGFEEIIHKDQNIIIQNPESDNNDTIKKLINVVDSKSDIYKSTIKEEPENEDKADTIKIDPDKNKEEDNLIQDFLPEEKDKTTNINFNRSASNQVQQGNTVLLNNILKDVDTSQTMIKNNDNKVANILQNVDVSTSIINPNPANLKETNINYLNKIEEEEANTSKRLLSIEDINKYFNNNPLPEGKVTHLDTKVNNILNSDLPDVSQIRYQTPEAKLKNTLMRNTYSQNKENPSHKLNAIINLVDELSLENLVKMRNKIKRMMNGEE